MKVLLILLDGMRPDAIGQLPYTQTLQAESTHCMTARTVMPSVTLPCHMSLFHSVDPSRHGITTNDFTPQVRPIDGICERLSKADLESAFFFDWEQLRDLARPGNMKNVVFTKGRTYSYRVTKDLHYEKLRAYLHSDDAADFTFWYIGWPDEAGHSYGWMGEEYMESLRSSFASIEQLLADLPEEYCVIITADHGGHERSHGTDMPEDMNIPVFFRGAPFEKGRALDTLSIKDIAPTITALLGAKAAPEWEGQSVLSR